MKFNPGEDFNQNISKLLSLLKNMMKNQKIDSQELNDFFGKKNVNLNLCFFTFVPFPFEEFDEMDFEEMGEEGLADMLGQRKDHDELKFEINNNDIDFLKKNGIKF